MKHAVEKMSAHVNSSLNGRPPTPDVVEVLRHLERGLVVTVFFHRKKPERRTLRVKLETRQLLWIKSQCSRPEGSGIVIYLMFLFMRFYIMFEKL